MDWKKGTPIDQCQLLCYVVYDCQHSSAGHVSRYWLFASCRFEGMGLPDISWVSQEDTMAVVARLTSKQDVWIHHGKKRMAVCLLKLMWSSNSFWRQD